MLLSSEICRPWTSPLPFVGRSLFFQVFKFRSQAKMSASCLVLKTVPNVLNSISASVRPLFIRLIWVTSSRESHFGSRLQKWTIFRTERSYFWTYSIKGTFSRQALTEKQKGRSFVDIHLTSNVLKHKLKTWPGCGNIDPQKSTFSSSVELRPSISIQAFSTFPISVQ